MSVIISAQERKDLRKIIEIRIGKLKSERNRIIAQLRENAAKAIDLEERETLGEVRAAFEAAFDLARKNKAAVTAKDADRYYRSSTAVSALEGVSFRDREDRIKRALKALKKSAKLMSEQDLTELGEDLCLEVIVSGITSEDAKNLLSRIPSEVTK